MTQNLRDRTPRPRGVLTWALFGLAACGTSTPAAPDAGAPLDARPPPPLVITTTDLPDGHVDVVYSATLTATGGVLPYHWAVSAGSLPTGVALDESTGEISGTPSAAEDASFTVEVTDSAVTPATTTQPLTIHVGRAPTPPVIDTTTPLPDGKVGIRYHETLAVSGGLEPYAWTLASGGLPPGLALDLFSGTIRGTPREIGDFAFTVQVLDSARQTATADLAIHVALPDPVVITTATLPPAATDTDYDVTLEATGGLEPYAWTLFAGSAPPGIALDTTAGRLSGTPTQEGTYPFTIRVSDSYATPTHDDQEFTIVVTAPLVIVTDALPPATVGVPYAASLQAAGGSPGYTWSLAAGAWPDGLTLDGATGAIGGTPTAEGSADLTIQVTDSASATATTNLTLTVGPAALSVVTATLPRGTVGVAYSTTLEAAGGTPAYAWSTADVLPDGLALDGATGEIGGTPTTDGTTDFTALVTDSAATPQVASTLLTLTIDRPLAIVTTALDPGTVGTPYSQTIAASGGSGVYTFSVTGNLPDGLSLDGATGEVSGTPTTSGSFAFEVTVTDSASRTATAALGIDVA